MKKIFMTLVAAVIAVSASAQVYVGGGVGVSAIDADGFDVTSYKLVPEIGYNLDNDWAVGIAFGWEGATKGAPKTIEVNPYARYTFVHSKLVNVFVDGGVAYKHAYNANNDEDLFSIGFKPGISVNLSDKLSFVTHVGFLGWEQDKDNAADTKVSAWSAGLEGNNITFGLYYNF